MGSSTVKFSGTYEGVRSHGWNMHEWEKDRWAATMFKRLWWLGYKGHCGEFSWPTYTTKALLDPDIPDKLWNYDWSEQRSWESATLLKDWINALNAKHPGKVRVIAHSMGNVITSEALLQLESPIVHSYIATQAAISGRFYDETVPDYPEGQYYVTPDVYGHYYNGVATGEKKTNPYMNPIRGKVTNGMFRLYNIKDYALRWWDTNNGYKPDAGYGFSGSPTNSYNQYERYPASDKYWPGFYSFTKFYLDQIETVSLSFTEPVYKLLFEQHRFHIFAYVARSPSRALGAVAEDVKGFLKNDDLQKLFGFDDTHYSHSRQFRSNIIREWRYWRLVIDRAGLPTVAPK